MYLVCFQEKEENFHFIFSSVEEQMYEMMTDYSVTNIANQVMNFITIRLTHWLCEWIPVSNTTDPYQMSRPESK